MDWRVQRGLGGCGCVRAERRPTDASGGDQDGDLRRRLLLVRRGCLRRVPGVTETVSGYAGGTKPNPTYGDHEGHVEAVKVTYDPAKVTYAKLLDTYWHNVDPFNPEGQFCDEGPPIAP